MIFSSVKSNFLSYVFSKRRVKGKDECLKILFLAIYRLLSEGYKTSDYKLAAYSIKNAKVIFDEFTTGKKIDYDKANIAVSNLYNLLKADFKKDVVKVDNEMVGEITKLLCYSKIERQMTEFKIGVVYFT